MRIQIVQDIIDVIRRKKVIVLVKAPPKKLTVPSKYKKDIFMSKSGAIICKDKKNFQDIVEYNKAADVPLFYNKLSRFCSKNIMPQRYKNKLKYFDEVVFPMLRPDDVICDVGCAAGDFTFEFAKRCKIIDGFELSQKMVDTANNRVKDENVKNLNFYQASCDEIEFKKTYDKCFLMGVLCYVTDDYIMEKTLKNIDKALKPGGYIIYRDNLNLTDCDYFIFGPSKAYKMVARSKDKVVGMFEKLNYKVVNDRILDTLQYQFAASSDFIETVSFTMILQ